MESAKSTTEVPTIAHSTPDTMRKVVLFVSGGMPQRWSVRWTHRRPVGGGRDTLRHAHRIAPVGGAEAI